MNKITKSWIVVKRKEGVYRGAIRGEESPPRPDIKERTRRTERTSVRTVRRLSPWSVVGQDGARDEMAFSYRRPPRKRFILCERGKESYQAT
ncbi:hypothetical protein E2C01_026159 [Portunus trituberculatus]|uniref:Uncharacterized protein n=1 Tax=Portunus trituberculatus TaxID=210409 RepID=A0A5B7EHM1_PORTR|nr:hypothetical protein [Portunus trituberculatus]